MPEPGRCPVVHFDHNSQEHSADPVASYRKLREQSPIAYSEAWDGYWILSGYKPLFEAARDDDRFSSQRNSHGGESVRGGRPNTQNPLLFPREVDPPQRRK